MLKEKLQTDVKEALKAGDSQRRMVLGLVLSAVKSRELEKRGKLSKTEQDTSKLEELSKLNEEEIIEVISSEIKKRKDSIEQYNKGGRPELAEKEKSEIEILTEYMPEQMSEDDIRKVVQQTIKDMALPAEATLAKAGQVIGSVMTKVKGKADGTTVSRIVKEELSK
ncbi:MAG: hypothetical protein A3B86_01880 [Candidatus Yanofskybacteria bacterium RIFCSPHIGHO2_02_FULL_38_22b]|uniref:Glutamyl-tRNA amidotransferase n=1 Tax=Candidatus Yanofskybacteria bacterium RIFCSPHIGHO2_02_FULL_38_22b TaxID=1802673 RepID=A0A1F8F4F3_9BACT|nr:MAG: hypothetical protein A2816_00780 [Candidatus Yanofskybacteria bacterium RIFCSPHIGHO2_01_FULL_39_44]OGN07139.1 MAG: hypothetical protein A3B86_01880 [Candidatus Yanofskybacteria bacterium RIFCSPHIGHO2_02_FULL_38_22b]OGN19989.1 MAG: hypothetical protein A2910_00590 [Candidatus Yanofskybacteria bacterium RIFCSPLOWO2_01_FULL_39_28]